MGLCHHDDGRLNRLAFGAVAGTDSAVVGTFQQSAAHQVGTRVEQQLAAVPDGAWVVERLNIGDLARPQRQHQSR